MEETMTNEITEDMLEDLISNYETTFEESNKRISTATVNFFKTMTTMAQKYKMATGIDHVYTMLLDRVNQSTMDRQSLISAAQGLSYDTNENIKEFLYDVQDFCSFDFIGKKAERRFVNKECSVGSVYGLVSELINIEIMQTIGDFCDRIIEFTTTVNDELDKQLETIHEIDPDYECTLSSSYPREEVNQILKEAFGD